MGAQINVMSGQCHHATTETPVPESWQAYPPQEIAWMMDNAYPGLCWPTVRQGYKRLARAVRVTRDKKHLRVSILDIPNSLPQWRAEASMEWLGANNWGRDEE